MAFTATTPNSAVAWRPDLHSFEPAAVIPDALILTLANIAGQIEGDAPSVRCAFIDDAAATITPEAEEIDQAQPTLGEVLVHTSKITQLVVLSNELARQQGTPEQVSASVARAVVKRADELFLKEPKPTAPAVAPAAGLLNIDGVVNGGAVTTNLDVLVDLVAQLQANRSNPAAIVIDPIGWGSLRKLKTATDHNTSLIGAGTQDSVPMLLGIPVVVSAEMPANTGLVVDPAATVAAVGPITVASSTDQFFSSDRVALRATWRLGINAVRPNRLGKFTIGAAARAK